MRTDTTPHTTQDGRIAQPAARSAPRRRHTSPLVRHSTGWPCAKTGLDSIPISPRESKILPAFSQCGVLFDAATMSPGRPACPLAAAREFGNLSTWQQAPCQQPVLAAPAAPPAPLGRHLHSPAAHRTHHDPILPSPACRSARPQVAPAPALLPRQVQECAVGTLRRLHR